ncbi:MAG: hypothetical protein AAGI52_06790 [Bacteroidota bacterium]
MIGRRPDFDRVAALDRERARHGVPDLARSLRIVEALREEAVALGRWEREDPLEGIDAKVRLAKAFAALRDV